MTGDVRVRPAPAGTEPVSGLAGFRQRYRSDAGEWDRAGRLPTEVLDAVRGNGWLGAAVPAAYGGADLDAMTFGRLCAGLGAVCSSVRSLVTVQSMVADVLARRGDASQRATWLPRLADGTVLAALAATEDTSGSDLAGVRTRIDRIPAGLRITGRKRWVTFGELARVFLVLGVSDAGPTAVLVPRDTPGLTVHPVRGQLGLRAAMLADVALDGAVVPAGNQLAGAGVGLTHVVAAALDHGRFSVAWGCVGMAEACLELSARHAVSRRTGTGVLADRQLVRRLVTDMVAAVTSARLVCEDAARWRQTRPRPDRTMLAKYVAARAAARVTRDAVQVLGAQGCAPGHPAERFFRDAKIMQIIEGADEICQDHVCDAEFRRWAGTATAGQGVG
ncbi:acyl-CoA dehydrogenase family protein [Micromonospora sp. NPDC023956]|uniref:acyl-CoA dehydrogenase family protein n=1 Tax=Micromonospora sp. NPDC023956 TaxID=3155722 RepID=UPI0034096C5F